MMVAVTRQARIQPRGRFVGGRFSLPSASAAQLEVRSPINPADVLAVFPCGADDADEAVAAAAAALPAWRARSVEARAEVLARIADALAPLSMELLVRMQRELGRPGWECQRELDGLVPRVRDVLDMARAELAERRDRASVRVAPRPLGVTAILGPVMFPLATSHGLIVAALAAGNTVVYKPSPLAATTAQLYAEALAAAGLPPGVFNLVHGDDAVGQRLVAQPRVDAVVFAGSADNARAIRRATADRLNLRTILHPGTRNSALVLDDAEVATTVRELLQGAFATAGQRAGAISRVLVAAPVIEPFLDELAAAARRLVVATPGPRSHLGPMFSRARAEQFLARLTAAEAEGARPVLAPSARGALVTPSIHFAEAGAAKRFRAEEPFGPSLLVEPIADLDDGIARLAPALYATLFSASRRAWQKFSAVEAGALLWNHAPASLSARVPFAAPGCAPSRGAAALRALTRDAAVCDAATGPSLAFPGVAHD
jgi:acyl-CoA reductase-like NAD-dependent aldehyde dehydrogenase